MRVCFVADPEGNIIELNQGYVDELKPPLFPG
jgi:glyoxylase I family protein